jgi:cell division protein ZapA
MADVRLSIAAREYIVTCRDGEEARLAELAKMVDEKVREAGGGAGGLSESRQLLFAALLLADQVKDNGGNTATPNLPASNGISDEKAARISQTLEKLAERLETLAAGVENSGSIA